MVEVRYDGNLGNNLFQYCFGRIIAEQLDYRLQAPPVAGFTRTAEAVHGADHSGGELKLLRGQRPDLAFLSEDSPRYHVVLNGYFQRFEFYKLHAAKIREWLAIEDDLDAQVNPNDIVVGIRRGRDYIPRHGLPISYYEEALALVPYERLFICTNDPKDPFIAHFQNKHGAVVRGGGAMDNFVFIKKFRNIVISNSTFHWWAAFLSEADTIVFPRPENGFWSRADPVSKGIDLEVDEARYRYLGCKRYASEFPAERLRNHLELANRSLRAMIRKVVPAPAPDGNRVRFDED